MAPSPEPTPHGEVPLRLSQVEGRLARIEQHLGLATPIAPKAPSPAASAPTPTVAERKAAQDDIEFEIGQNWFAKVGIVVLTAGLAFTLTNPFPTAPAWLPSAVGYVLAAAVFFIAHRSRRSFEVMSRFFRGSAMVLLFFATLRLSFFGESPLLAPASIPALGLLLGTIGVNLAIGWWRQSPALFVLAAISCVVGLLAVNSAWFLLVILALLSAIVALACLRQDWPWVLIISAPLVFLTYAIWALNNPFLTREIQLLEEPRGAPWFLLGYLVMFAAGSFLRRNRTPEDLLPGVNSIVLCAAGYGTFLLHTLAAAETPFVFWHLGAAAVLISLAVVVWRQEQSLVSTFVYAMSGYAALSFAIIKAVEMPDVFVWLSLESVVVVTTAIYFRSRFIVVANFLIFLGIILGYIVLAEGETGISLVFGVVALVTARILNWKKDRLELTTEMMRNAYLVSALAIFPYALYHLVPPAFVALAWIGIAAAYYLLHLVFKNRKYRWMGHSTLGLTVIYVIVVGIGRLEPAHRNLSFLALGVVLLVISFIFTRVQAKKRAAKENPPESGES